MFKKLAKQLWFSVVKQDATQKHRKLLHDYMRVDGNFKQMTFTFAVIAIAAKLAKSDGTVNEKEFDAFCKMFPIGKEAESKTRKLFFLAAAESMDVSHYARQINHLFIGQSDLLEDILIRLYRIAEADGHITAQERKILTKIADAFNVKRVVMNRLMGVPLTSSTDLYELLGVSRRTSNDDIKRAYRDRLWQLHPDRMGDASTHYQGELATLNAAYEALAKKRKIK